MKKNVFRLSLILILTLCATFFTALTLKANIGTYACWDALSVNVSQLTGLKVAHFSMVMNVICVLLQILMLRKDFKPVRLLQIPFVILFSSLVNFFYYNVLTFELHNYFIRFALCIISIIGVSFFLGILTSLNLITLSVETTCSIASGKYSIDYAVLRIGIDVICIIVSLALTLIFGLSFAIREGTFIAMVLLGSLEKVFMNIFQRLSEKAEIL